MTYLCRECGRTDKVGHDAHDPTILFCEGCGSENITRILPYEEEAAYPDTMPDQK